MDSCPRPAASRDAGEGGEAAARPAALARQQCNLLLLTSLQASAWAAGGWSTRVKHRRVG